MSETVVSTETPEDAAVVAFKAKIIDGAVRAARENGWCSHFETAMARVFPEGSGQPRGQWYDSDGFTCRGYDYDGFDSTGHDERGYDRDGFNHDGRDRDGYDRDGYDRSGYNREGVNSAGVKFDDPENPFRYDRDGYDVNGWHVDGAYNINGNSRTQARERCKYDRDGYDATGHNRYGDRRRDS